MKTFPSRKLRTIWRTLHLAYKREMKTAGVDAAHVTKLLHLAYKREMKTLAITSRTYMEKLHLAYKREMKMLSSILASTDSRRGFPHFKRRSR